MRGAAVEMSRLLSGRWWLEGQHCGDSLSLADCGCCHPVCELHEASPPWKSGDLAATASHRTSCCRSPNGAELEARVHNPRTGCLCQSNGLVQGVLPEEDKNKSCSQPHYH